MTSSAPLSYHRDDPMGYASFDEFVAGAASPWSLQALARRWSEVRVDQQVDAQGDWTPSSQLQLRPDALGRCTKQRVLAGIQLLAGGLELVIAGGALLAPEPTGTTKVLGTVMIPHGIDTVQASSRGILSCKCTATLTHAGARAIAEYAGASPATAETIGVVTDVSIGGGGSLAIGTLSKIAPGGSRLVHLTSADAAAKIRASQTLGLPNVTTYAGGATLAQAQGLEHHRAYRPHAETSDRSNSAS